MIIDCHTHLNQYESQERISSLEDLVEKLRVAIIVKR